MILEYVVKLVAKHDLSRAWTNVLQLTQGLVTFLTLVKMILISKAAWLSALVFMATVLKIALAVLIVEMVAMAVQIHFANLP